jgi:AhpC/TSA family/Disulphide bond corrector protein DsbC
VELERDLVTIRKHGLGLAAISYDSVAVLKNFADRQKITFTLLSDPESHIIRAFGILNETVQPTSAQYGIPHPGTYIVDTGGRVVAKYFEEDMRERMSASAILAGRFGEPVTAGRAAVEAKHVALTTAASTAVAMPGHRILLTLELNLPSNTHVYAPGVTGYIPIDWKIEEAGGMKPQAVQYPAPEKLYLKPIKETALVYRRHVRLTREITLGQEAALKPLVGPSGELVLKGSFRYQACDDRECYVPENVPLEWRFQFQGMERERVPAELQRKGH